VVTNFIAKSGIPDLHYLHRYCTAYRSEDPNTYGHVNTGDDCSVSDKSLVNFGPNAKVYCKMLIN